MVSLPWECKSFPEKLLKSRINLSSKCSCHLFLKYLKNKKHLIYGKQSILTELFIKGSRVISGRVKYIKDTEDWTIELGPHSKLLVSNKSTLLGWGPSLDNIPCSVIQTPWTQGVIDWYK